VSQHGDPTAELCAYQPAIAGAGCRLLHAHPLHRAPRPQVPKPACGRRLERQGAPGVACMAAMAAGAAWVCESVGHSHGAQRQRTAQHPPSDCCPPLPRSAVSTLAPSANHPIGQVCDFNLSRILSGVHGSHLPPQHRQRRQQPALDGGLLAGAGSSGDAPSAHLLPRIRSSRARKESETCGWYVTIRGACACARAAGGGGRRRQRSLRRIRHGAGAVGAAGAEGAVARQERSPGAQPRRRTCPRPPQM
jgi:hypothetical protein